MYKDLSNKGNAKYVLYIKGGLLGVAVTTAFVLLFSLVLNFLELSKNLAPLFGTLSVAFGALTSAFYIARKKGNRGLLTGAIIGGITFILVTLISLIADKGSVTSNTLFHFVIFMLSSLIGGVLGVNKKKNEKYI